MIRCTGVYAVKSYYQVDTVQYNAITLCVGFYMGGPSVFRNNHGDSTDFGNPVATNGSYFSQLY